jgi:hypothetical protein
VKKVGARFRFTHHRHGTVTVVYSYDADGEPTDVQVKSGDRSVLIVNTGGDLKPCVTHCETAVGMAFDEKPKTNHERSRRDELRQARPALRIVGSDAGEPSQNTLRPTTKTQRPPRGSA